MKVRFFTYTLLTVFLMSENAYAAGSAALNWSDLLPRVINFAILVGVLFYFARKPVINGLKSAIASRSGEYFRAKNEEKEAHMELAQFEKDYRKLEIELEEYKQAMIKEASVEKVQIVESAKAVAMNMKQQAESMAVGRTQTVQRDLMRNIVNTAAGQLEKEILQGSVKISSKTANDNFISSVKE